MHIELNRKVSLSVEAIVDENNDNKISKIFCWIEGEAVEIPIKVLNDIYDKRLQERIDESVFQRNWDSKYGR